MKITLTSGEIVESTRVTDCTARLPGGRLVATFTEGGTVYQDPDQPDPESHHTPGPWEVKGDPDLYNEHEYSVPIIAANTDNHDLVAEVLVTGDLEYDTTVTAANISLIAAAPHLLEACQCIYEDLDNGGEIYQNDRERMRVLLEAIEHATGKEVTL